MASYESIMRCALAGMAVSLGEAAAAPPSPLMVSTNTVTTSDQGTAPLTWLKITVVPLGVFLIGACSWGCMESTGFWRSVSGRRIEESSIACVEPPRVSFNSDAYQDLEAGSLELRDSRNVDDDLAAASAQAPLAECQGKPLES